MQSNEHQYPLIVAASDLDDLGHVNNARYLDYLERGRTRWYREVGLIRQCADALGISELGTVVVNVNIDFKRECAADDALVVTTQVARVGARSFTVTQQVLKASREVAATATVTSVVMDLAERRSVVLPPSALTLLV